MSKKTKIIFISTFIIISLLIISILFFIRKYKKGTTNVGTTQQPFNSFGINNKTTPTSGNINVGEKNTKITWVNGSKTISSKFTQITNFAVSGASFFEKTINKQNTNTSNSINEIIPELEYVKSSNGHIYKMNLKTKAVTEISNSTILGVHDVTFDSLGDTFVYRYFSNENDSIASFVSSLKTKKGEFLPFNIIDISLSPDKNSFFYLIKTLNGVTGYTKSFVNSKTSEVFNSPFSEWLSQWVSNKIIFLTTKASASVNGALFSLNTQNQTLTKIFGDVKGLTTLANHDGSFVLYGKSSNIGPKLWLLNTQTHTTKDLDSYGLPEKCVWSNNNIYVYCAVPNTIVGMQYPDLWYQGLVSFNDYFLKINIRTNEQVTLANSKNEIPVDATHLFLNKKESKLFFINKKDSTLWSLDL